MATSRIQVSEGSGKNIATNSFSEDSVTKEAQRVVLNNSSGTEIGTTANPMKVDGSGVTQPVSGTVTANTGLTQPLTDAQLRATPVPVEATIDTTGLATDATDTNTATIAGDTTSIDGKIPALGQALAAASVPVVLTAAQITTITPPAAITGFATSAKQDTLLTELQLKADLTETQPVSLASVPSHAVTNAGTFAVQSASTLAAETTKVIGTVNIAAAQTLATITTVSTVSAVTAITNALPAGTNAIGKLSANSGVDIGDVDVTSISAGTNAIGNVGLVGRTSGGLTIFRSIDIDESEEEVKAIAGQLFSITAFNTTAAPLYLKFYNLTAANTTVGSSTPVLTYVVPGNADSDGAGFVWNNDVGLAFSTAISVACTTAVADADTGAPSANACIINLGYM